jgi:hypothetical protein
MASGAYHKRDLYSEIAELDCGVKLVGTLGCTLNQGPHHRRGLDPLVGRKARTMTPKPITIGK